MGRTKGFILCLLVMLSTSPLFCDELGIVQETSLGAQIQTVQAEGYWGTQQTSLGAQWSLGLDWNRLLTLRAGLAARSTQTTAVTNNTVYPGYQGWGWVGALDWLPLQYEWDQSFGGVGLTVGGSWEFLDYPGLYRNFSLKGATLAFLAEMTLSKSSGLTYRFRVPVTVDQREKFSLSWRFGLEFALLFRGIGLTF